MVVMVVKPKRNRKSGREIALERLLGEAGKVGNEKGHTASFWFAKPLPRFEVRPERNKYCLFFNTPIDDEKSRICHPDLSSPFLLDIMTLKSNINLYVNNSHIENNHVASRSRACSHVWRSMEAIPLRGNTFLASQSSIIKDTDNNSKNGVHAVRHQTKQTWLSWPVNVLSIVVHDTVSWLLLSLFPGYLIVCRASHGRSRTPPRPKATW